MSIKEEYIQDEKVRYLKDILMNFDKFEIWKKYIWKYNPRLRDYEYELHRLNENTIYMYIMNNKIEITRITNNKFEITINLNDYRTIAERRRFMEFLKYENRRYKGYLLWYYHGNWHIDLGNLILSLRKNNNILKLIIVKKTKEYYLTLPELEMKPLPDKEYGFPIEEKSLYLYKINGKSVTKKIEYYKEKYKGMPYMIRVKIKNRKYEYAIFRMMLNKEIVEYRDIPTFITIKRIKNIEIENSAWMFTNVVTLNLQKIRGAEFPDFAFAVLQDYYYDGVNQIIMKFIDELRNSYLCGIDYTNRMWCMRLPGIMYKYKIKSVYKVLYDLDANTKLFEF